MVDLAEEPRKAQEQDTAWLMERLRAVPPPAGEPPAILLAWEEGERGGITGEEEIALATLACVVEEGLTGRPAGLARVVLLDAALTVAYLAGRGTVLLSQSKGSAQQ